MIKVCETDMSEKLTKYLFMYEPAVGRTTVDLSKK